jgi:uncharacterized membrane protein/thiol-disulfide isomerase/thioredoxin
MSRLFSIIVIFSTWFYPNAQAENIVVRAVLFYSPSCGHCHYVIQEVLPPLIEKYGNKLQIMGVDVSQSGGQILFRTVLEEFKPDSSGVPLLIVGDEVLIGSVDIPEKFPDLIEQHLAKGGVDWPDIPGLDQALSAAQSTQEASASALPAQASPSAIPTILPDETILVPTPEVGFTATPTKAAVLIASSTEIDLWERLARDPWGNTLAIVILLGMILALIGLVFYLRRVPSRTHSHNWNYPIPVLCALGLGVAGYLAYVETAQVSAICGPVGDCNAVQQSEYARLFGILPIGILGLAGFIAMGISWAISRFGKDQPANVASLMLFAMSLFGVLFSMYLTFLEPFVIGATCAWCLTSAILMTILLWLSAPPAVQVLSRLRGEAGLHRATD